MRNAVLGTVMVAGLVAMAFGAMPQPDAVQAYGTDSPNSAAAGREWITHATIVEGRYQQLVVVDPKQECMAVYHVELGTGEVELKCVRNVSWDLQMLYFNGKEPLPPDMKALMQHR